MRHYLSKVHSIFYKYYLYSKNYKLLQNSVLFDAGWYINTYPDVSRMNDSPIGHYLKVGYLQGYDPSCEFSTEAYLNANPDVKSSGMNPLVHYIRYGISEQRTFNRDNEYENLIDPNFKDLDFNSFYEKTLKHSVQKNKIFKKPHADHTEVLKNIFYNKNSLVFTQKITDDLYLENSWFASNQTLRCCFSNTTNNKRHNLYCYQWNSMRSIPKLCMALSVKANELFFCDVVLTNPMMPILFLVEDDSANCLAKKILYFPSLLEGGIHQFERINDDEFCSFSDRLELNNKYSQVCFKKSRPVEHLSVFIDVFKANGNETVSSSFFKHWLREVFAITLVAQNHDGSRSGDVYNYIHSLYDENLNIKCAHEAFSCLHLPMISELITLISKTNQVSESEFVV